MLRLVDIAKLSPVPLRVETANVVSKTVSCRPSQCLSMQVEAGKKGGAISASASPEERHVSSFTFISVMTLLHRWRHLAYHPHGLVFMLKCCSTLLIFLGLLILFAPIHAGAWYEGW